MNKSMHHEITARSKGPSMTLSERQFHVLQLHSADLARDVRRARDAEGAISRAARLIARSMRGRRA